MCFCIVPHHFMFFFIARGVFVVGINCWKSRQLCFLSGIYVVVVLYRQLDLPQPIKITYIRKLILSFVIYVFIYPHKRYCSMLDSLIIIDLCMLRTTHRRGDKQKRCKPGKQSYSLSKLNYLISYSSSYMQRVQNLKLQSFYLLERKFLLLM